MPRSLPLSSMHEGIGTPEKNLERPQRGSGVGDFRLGAEQADLWNSMEGCDMEDRLEPAPRPLLGGQDLEARRPPPGPDGLDEFGRERLLLHLPRERLRIVGDRDEFRLVPAGL